MQISKRGYLKTYDDKGKLISKVLIKDIPVEESTENLLEQPTGLTEEEYYDV